MTELAIAFVVGRASMIRFVACAPYTTCPPAESIDADEDESWARVNVCRFGAFECCECDAKMHSINFSSWIERAFFSPTIGCEERVMEPCDDGVS